MNIERSAKIVVAQHFLCDVEADDLAVEVYDRIEAADSEEALAAIFDEFPVWEPFEPGEDGSNFVVVERMEQLYQSICAQFLPDSVGGQPAHNSEGGLDEA